MRITEVVEMIRGDLINHPQISQFNIVTTRLDRVKQGCLFIATNSQDIQEAVALGAYGIIFEDHQIRVIDEECAWIKVDSLNDALTRLIRYKLLINNISMIFFKPIAFEIAQQICTDPSVEFLQGGYADLLECVQKIGVKKVITQNYALHSLPLEPLEAILPQTDPFKLISFTLFDSKIYFDSKRYTLSLPSLFLGYLASVITLFDSENISFALQNFEYISHLRPIFVTSKTKICPYGQSGRVLLAEKEQDRFIHYANYITDHAKWAKIAFFTPQNKSDSFPQAIPYENTEILLESLKKQEFNFALILGLDTEYLLENLQEIPREMSLFDA